MTGLTSRAWRPSPFITASIALHAAAAAAVLVRPRLWPWAIGAVVADHLALTAAGLWPRSSLLGPNWTRLPDAAAARGDIAITIDDGPDPDVTPKVLALLDARGVTATFFCIGTQLELHPDLGREIHARGHAIENHSYRHPNTFSLLGPAAMAAEVARGQDCIMQAIGTAPRFFRAPAGLRNPFLQPVLARLGLQLASWTRRGFDTVNGDASAVLARLTRSLAGGDIVLLHDGHAARSRAGVPIILEVLPRLLDAIADRTLEPVTLRGALEANA
jgi:peptidoglycan/xylan/chitin deacetylase (PgdA/CDA1 family)